MLIYVLMNEALHESDNVSKVRQIVIHHTDLKMYINPFRSHPEKNNYVHRTIADMCTVMRNICSCICFSIKHLETTIKKLQRNIQEIVHAILKNEPVLYSL